MVEDNFKFGTQAWMEKLKMKAVLIGHEKCASSNFSAEGTLVVCAMHQYKEAVSVLHNGTYYYACPECIKDFCTVIPARTEEKARGIWEDMRE